MPKENNGNGYIKLYRKLKDWDWYDNLITKSVYIHILLSVNHKQGKWQGIIIEKGSYITSVNKLASETHLSERNIRTAIKHLISTNDITTKATNKYTLIKVVKWASYQVKELVSDKLNNKQADKRPTSKRQASDKQVTTNNND